MKSALLAMALFYYPQPHCERFMVGDFFRVIATCERCCVGTQCQTSCAWR